MLPAATEHPPRSLTTRQFDASWPWFLTMLTILLSLMTTSTHAATYSDATSLKGTFAVYSNTVFLNVTAPSALQGTIPFSPALGGSSLPASSRADGTIDVTVMLPHAQDDVSACNQPWRTTNEFNQSFAGSWVLMQHSDCSFGAFRFASMSGAAGILVYGCPTTAPYNCDPHLIEAVVYVPLVNDVPVISITNVDGAKLVNYLQALKANGPPPTNSVILRLQSTGNIVPAERAALLAIMQQSTMTKLSGGTIPETLPLWSVERFSDPTIDPCRNRTVGIWCENSHIVYINIPYHGFTNTNPKNLPKEFGVFTKLRYLGLDTNNFRGSIPAEWCSFVELKSLTFNSNLGITSLPDCMGQWQALEELDLQSNALVALPDGIRQLSNLKFLSVQVNAITSIPDLSGLSKLEIVNLGGNKLTGAFPSFHPQAPLRELCIASNSFTGPIPTATLSAYASTLEVLDCNHNFLNGALPALNSFSKLRILDLSSQRGTPLDPKLVGLTGAMPSGWGNLFNLAKLRLQENSLSGPFLVSNMLSLQYFDLSNNRLTSATVSDPSNNDLGQLFYDLTSPAMVSLKLSYNLLTGPLTTGNYILLPTFREIFFDHNQVTSLPRELLLGGFRSIDASHNNLTNPFFVGVPAVDFVLFDVRGNPDYQLDPTQPLPSWIAVTETYLQQKNEAFSCASLSSVTAPQMVFNVDPTFYSYQFCNCQPGFMGSAPACASVPDTATLNPTRMITSDELGAAFPNLITRTGGLGGDLFATTKSMNSTGSAFKYSQAVSDSMYGDTNRLTVGMLTSWVFDLSDLFADDVDALAAQGLLSVPGGMRGEYQVNNSAKVLPTWTPVRVITVRLHINLGSFNAFEDQLSVYEGGSDLLGNRALLLRGTSDRRAVTYSNYASTADYQALYNASLAKLGNNTSLIEVRVFSPIATLQFTSRAMSGTHFYATYSYDFDCPDGYYYEIAMTPAQCRVNRVIFRVGDGIRSAVYAVAAVAMAFVLVNLVLLFTFWHYPVYKAASRVFMLLTLVFLLAMSLGALLYAAVPSAGTRTGAAICNGRAWLSCLPLAGILGVILAKSNRLNSIFGSTTLQVKAMTDAQIAKTVFTVCLIQIGMLAIFSGLPLSRAIQAVGKGSLSDELVDQCSQENGFMSWIGAEIAYIGCLMLPAAYLGFKTRDLPSQFNESAHIQNALVLLIFFGVIIVPLDIFIQDNPEAAVLIQGLGQAFLTIILTAIIFLPKAYYLHYAVSKQPGRVVSADGNATMMDTAAPDSFTNQATIPAGAKPPSSGNKQKTPQTRNSSLTITPPPYPVSHVHRASSLTTKKEVPSATGKILSQDFHGVMASKPPSTAVSVADSRPISPPTLSTTAAHGATTDPPATLPPVATPINPSPVSSPVSEEGSVQSPRRKIRVHMAGSALEEMVRGVGSNTPSSPPPRPSEPSNLSPTTTTTSHQPH